MNVKGLPTITFEQSWQGVEWAAKQTFRKGEVETQFNYIKKPDDKICESLDEMHNAFYPNEAHKTLKEATKDLSVWDLNVATLQIDNYSPWILHQALYALIASKRLSPKRYRAIITQILKREWLLSWHWRAVLPSLRDWNERATATKLIIQISHVRKWEMLLCYKVKAKDLATHAKLSEIPLSNKDLIRAPLFGISHRLKGWDTYRLFYQPDIKKYVEREFKDKEKSPSKNLGYVLGRHDCYYIVEKLRLINDRYRWTLRTFVEAEPERALVDRKILGTRSFYHKPTDLIDIPSFTTGHKGIPQLLSSDHYCEAILELTEVLNDPTAKSVLLIAPPGSGKEKLAESAFYCRDRTKPSTKFIATTLAGLNAAESARLLFSIHEDSRRRADKIDLTKTFEPHPKDGLLLRALGGALFIDEIDKTDNGTRGLLLRVLESGEITVPDSSQILEIPKPKRPLYVFAGSMNRQSMFQGGPVDFWTRISHIIDVAHPLGIDDMDKSRSVMKDYLWMFWCIHVKDFMERKGVSKNSKARKIVRPLNEFYLSLYEFLIDQVTVDFATEILADEVSGRGKPLISIRTLRSIVARSLFKFVDVLLYSKFQNDPIENFKELSKNDFSNKKPKAWFQKLRTIIEVECNRKLSNPSARSEEESRELSVVNAFTTAIRLGAALAQ